MPDVPTFQVLHAQFANDTTTYLQTWMTQIEAQLDTEFWGQHYDQAVYYLLCHTLTEQRRASLDRAGPVTSQSNEEQSLAFSDAKDSDSNNPYGSTPCGRLYWALLQSKGGTAAMVTGCRYSTIHRRSFYGSYGSYY